jgi:hypothetical protein
VTPAPTLPTRSFAQAQAELRLGRSLTTGELAIDIERADADLAEGKARLAAAIEKEKRRVVKAHLSGRVGRMKVTPEMILALRWLYGRGRDHALAEMERLGVKPRRRRTYARSRGNVPSKVAAMIGSLRRRLFKVDVRVNEETARLRFEAEAGRSISMLAAEIERQIPGALEAASYLVSTGFTAGVADVYEAHADLFSGWQYTAVMDNATCDECEARDGEEYRTIEEMYAVLPDFGPNPDCYGEGRCRCRGVPLGD